MRVHPPLPQTDTEPTGGVEDNGIVGFLAAVGILVIFYTAAEEFNRRENEPPRRRR